MLLLKSACRALSAIADHGRDAQVDDELLYLCVEAALSALSLVQRDTTGYAEDDEHRPGLRTEAAHAVASVCAASLELRQFVRMRNAEIPLLIGFRRTADGLGK